MEILGMRIDNLSREGILEKIESFLSGDKFNQIATINPEFILAAQKEEEFKNILNNCDLNIADGIGIKFAFWRYGQKLKARIAGADLVREILKMANDRGLGVYLAADKNGLSSWEETTVTIKKIYPNVKISGENINSDILKHPNFQFPISNFQNYDIVFCNFGAPFQEKFLHSLKNLNNSKIRLTMGVGGSFDYLTGKVKRAPQWMRRLGLEWLWRLIQQPWGRKLWRLNRIWKAVIIFPTKVILS